jgi:ribose transport system ATP-binding protein
MSDAIVLDRISKTYGSTRALAETSLTVKAGTVHALLGENGAGKSTIAKVLSGIVRPDDGRIVVFGEDVHIADSVHASRLGIETAFQEVPLIADLTVQDNLLLPRQPKKWGVFLDRRAARERVDAIRTMLEISDIDAHALVRELDLSQRQKIEIARAISRDPRILILDEPTAALSKADVDWLGQRIAALKASGTTIILVTHRMPEVHEFCSSMSILRNGRHVGSYRVGEIEDEDVFRHIMGRSVDVTFPKRATGTMALKDTKAAPLLEARGLGVGHQLKSVDLALRAGEIVGIAALQGMGQLELFNALFGAERPSSGSVLVGGRPGHFGSPADAIAAGIALVPEDRKIQGLALHRSGTENASLPIIGDFSRGGLVSRGKETAEVDAAFASVNLHPRALHQSPAEFSGGNQQKIVLAKWLLTRCKALLVFDPTRGVDIGTKQEIYALLRRFADEGGGILFHSTELPELIGNCDRILVLYRGRFVGEVAADSADEETIGALMLGVRDQAQRKSA